MGNCRSLYRHQQRLGLDKYWLGHNIYFTRFYISGDEVRDSYGSMFCEEEQEERREKLLKNFWFKCLCMACRKRWPTREDLPCNMFEVESISENLII